MTTKNLIRKLIRLDDEYDAVEDDRTKLRSKLPHVFLGDDPAWCALQRRADSLCREMGRTERILIETLKREAKKGK